MCCDLLKIHYLCGWNDNAALNKSAKCIVVICSKFITFVVEMTTSIGTKKALLQLWFAQNSLPLWLKWQPVANNTITINSCDLLKIHYLCGWNDNLVAYLALYIEVVICSKFITFVVEMTTNRYFDGDFRPLWFAQNSLPLWLKWQRSANIASSKSCCDLLKIHYLCGWNDNISFTFDCVSDRYMLY